MAEGSLPAKRNFVALEMVGTPLEGKVRRGLKEQGKGAGARKNVWHSCCSWLLLSLLPRDQRHLRHSYNVRRVLKEQGKAGFLLEKCLLFLLLAAVCVCCFFICLVVSAISVILILVSYSSFYVGGTYSTPGRMFRVSCRGCSAIKYLLGVLPSWVPA